MAGSGDRGIRKPDDVEGHGYRKPEDETPTDVSGHARYRPGQDTEATDDDQSADED